VLLLVAGLAVIAAAGVALFGAAQHAAPPGSAAPPAPGVPSGPGIPVLLGQPGTANATAARIAQSADYQSPAVRAFVDAHTAKGAGGPSTLADVFSVWEAIYANWTYVRDPPGFNLYLPASRSVTGGMKGNCLDYAILNAAAVESLGGTARVIAAYDREGNGHAYTEIYVGDSMDAVRQVGDYIAARYSARTVHWHIADGPSGEKEYWLNLDWQAGYPGGPIFADNGAYYASFLSGKGARYADNGTEI